MILADNQCLAYRTLSRTSNRDLFLAIVFLLLARSLLAECGTALFVFALGLIRILEHIILAFDCGDAVGVSNGFDELFEVEFVFATCQQRGWCQTVATREPRNNRLHTVPDNQCVLFRAGPSAAADC